MIDRNIAAIIVSSAIEKKNQLSGAWLTNNPTLMDEENKVLHSRPLAPKEALD